MMNIDFRFIIIDYWKMQDVRTKLVILWFPLLVIVGGLIASFVAGKDFFASNVGKTYSVLIPLLALMLTGITLLTNWKSNPELREYDTNRSLRKEHVSLYEYMVINYSYVIVFDLLLLLSYVIAGLFPDVTCFLWGLIMNALFTFCVLHLLLVMLINIGDLFFVLTKKEDKTK